MNSIKSNVILDAKGLACPMPIVKTKKAMKELEAGHVLEVQATDKGSKADLKAWAESTGNQYLGTIEDGGVLRHFVRKSGEEEKPEKNYPVTASNEELEQKLDSQEDIIVLDVRESAEYAFRHIPGAISLPLGELEERCNEINQESTVYVICRTGSRSDLAAQKLAEKGYQHVVNVLPGMSGWKGKTESINP